MRTTLAVVTAALLTPLVTPAQAQAGRHTVGVALGRSQSEAAASDGLDASSTTGLWWRIGVGRYLAGEFSFAKISTQDDAVQVRAVDVTGRLTVARLAKDKVAPQVLIGLGLDSTTGAPSYHHVEVGLGVDYHLSDRFTLGAEFRLGDRSQVATQVVDEPTPVIFREASSLDVGSYRTGRVYLGMRL